MNKLIYKAFSFYKLATNKLPNNFIETIHKCLNKTNQRENIDDEHSKESLIKLIDKTGGGNKLFSKIELMNFNLDDRQKFIDYIKEFYPDLSLSKEKFNSESLIIFLPENEDVNELYNLAMNSVRNIKFILLGIVFGFSPKEIKDFINKRDYQLFKYNNVVKDYFPEDIAKLFIM